MSPAVPANRKYVTTPRPINVSARSAWRMWSDSLMNNLPARIDIEVLILKTLPADITVLIRKILCPCGTAQGWYTKRIAVC